MCKTKLGSKARCFCVRAAPDFPPRNVTVRRPLNGSSSTAAHISWSPPKRPNGKIAGELISNHNISILSKNTPGLQQLKFVESVVTQTTVSYLPGVLVFPQHMMITVKAIVISLRPDSPSGYIVLFTTNASNPDAEWTVQGILGEVTNTTIQGLVPNTYYHFKVTQARTPPPPTHTHTHI